MCGRPACGEFRAIPRVRARRGFDADCSSLDKNKWSSRLRWSGRIFYSVLEMAGIEPTVNFDFLRILKVLLAKCGQSTCNGNCRPIAEILHIRMNNTQYVKI